MTVSDLPGLNASLNATATVLLIVGFILIKLGKKNAHRICMVSAFSVSVIFLITYVLHKILVHGIHTPLGAEGAIRTFYLIMLTTHIILAMVIVPLILVTLTHAIKGRFERHRAWAKWTYPLWLYVSVTGVLVYLMLYRWYPA